MIYAIRSSGWKKTTSFLRATTFCRFPKICAHRRSDCSTVSGRRRCVHHSCDRRIRIATAFYHHHDYWTSWLQPYESSV
jgi:hypothetical protein